MNLSIKNLVKAPQKALTFLKATSWLERTGLGILGVMGSYVVALAWRLIT